MSYLDQILLTDLLIIDLKNSLINIRSDMEKERRRRKEFSPISGEDTAIRRRAYDAGLHCTGKLDGMEKYHAELQKAIRRLGTLEECNGLGLEERCKDAREVTCEEWEKAIQGAWERGHEVMAEKMRRGLRLVHGESIILRWKGTPALVYFFQKVKEVEDRFEWVWVQDTWVVWEAASAVRKKGPKLWWKNQVMGELVEKWGPEVSRVKWGRKKAQTVEEETMLLLKRVKINEKAMDELAERWGVWITKEEREKKELERQRAEQAIERMWGGRGGCRDALGRRRASI